MCIKRPHLTRVIEERSTKGLANLLPDCISTTIDVNFEVGEGRGGRDFAPAHRKRIRASTGEINETNHGLSRTASLLMRNFRMSQKYRRLLNLNTVYYLKILKEIIKSGKNAIWRFI